jgi:hypothetical protein
MDELLDRFQEIRTEFIDVLRRFHASKRTERLFNPWCLKDAVAHLAGWDRYFVDIVDALEAGEKPAYWGSMAKFNAASVEKRKDQSWDSVFDEFVTNGEAFIRRCNHIPESMWTARFWDHKSITPVQMLEINIHHYGKDHLAAVKKVLARFQ